MSADTDARDVRRARLMAGRDAAPEQYRTPHIDRIAQSALRDQREFEAKLRGGVAENDRIGGGEPHAGTAWATRSDDRGYADMHASQRSNPPAFGGSMRVPNNADAHDDDPEDAGKDYLSTEDGSQIVTEDGSRIALEGVAEPLEDGSDYEGIHRAANGIDQEPLLGSGVTMRVPIDTPDNDDETGGYYEGVNDRGGWSGAPVDSADWTGARTSKQRVRLIRSVAPMALAGLDQIVFAIETQNFQAPETQDALAHLRNLHAVIGDLLREAEEGKISTKAKEAFNASKRSLLDSVDTLTLLFAKAPVLTFGIVHILAMMGGVPVDSTLMSTVYGIVCGPDIAKKVLGRNEAA